MVVLVVRGGVVAEGDGVAGEWMACRYAGLAATAAGGGEGVGAEGRWRYQAWRGSAAARDFHPSSDLPLCNFGPSPLLLSSQGPFLL